MRAAPVPPAPIMAWAHVCGARGYMWATHRTARGMRAQHNADDDDRESGAERDASASLISGRRCLRLGKCGRACFDLERELKRR